MSTRGSNVVVFSVRVKLEKHKLLNELLCNEMGGKLRRRTLWTGFVTAGICQFSELFDFSCLAKRPQTFLITFLLFVFAVLSEIFPEALKASHLETFSRK